MVGEPVGSSGPAHELEGHGEARIHGQRRQHVDPHEPDDGVAEALRDTDDGVKDARVVDVLAARPRHGGAEDAPHEREADAGEDDRDHRRPDQVGSQEGADAKTHDDPDARRETLVHEADGESVPHREASYETAGFAGKG